MAIDDNQRIVGANRVARRSLLLDDRALLAGISLWTLFERDLDLFRRKDRTDICTRLLVAGSNDSWPALVTPPDHTMERLEHANEHQSAYASASGFDWQSPEARAGTASARRTVGRRDAAGTGIRGGASG